MKKVEVFELEDPADCGKYETLLNDPSVIIYKEEFAYIKMSGSPKVTVWYEREGA